LQLEEIGSRPERVFTSPMARKIAREMGKDDKERNTSCIDDRAPIQRGRTSQ
jgi:hypothetical protein